MSVHRHPFPRSLLPVGRPFPCGSRGNGPLPALPAGPPSPPTPVGTSLPLPSRVLSWRGRPPPTLTEQPPLSGPRRASRLTPEDQASSTLFSSLRVQDSKVRTTHPVVVNVVLRFQPSTPRRRARSECSRKTPCCAQRGLKIPGQAPCALWCSAPGLAPILPWC